METEPDLSKLIIIAVASIFFLFAFWIEENEKDLKWYSKLLNKIFGRTNKNVNTDLTERKIHKEKPDHRAGRD